MAVLVFRHDLKFVKLIKCFNRIFSKSVVIIAAIPTEEFAENILSTTPENSASFAENDLSKEGESTNEFSISSGEKPSEGVAIIIVISVA